MNQLYRPHYIREVTINNRKTFEVLRYVSNTYNYIRYGIPETNEKESTEWKELLHELDYVPEFEGNKDKKGNLWAEVDYTDKYDYKYQKKVYQNQFISVKSYMCIIPINPQEIRMKELVNELNADEFISYLRDNGIGKLHIS
jgi:hypothetical protein